MTDIHECPKCKTKFTKFRDFTFIIDESIPSNVIRFTKADGKYYDLHFESGPKEIRISAPTEWVIEKESAEWEDGVGQDTESDSSKSSVKSPT